MADNQDAVEVMGDASLCLIAHEFSTSLKGSVAIDRAHGERAQTRMRILLKRIPKRHGPPRIHIPRGDKTKDFRGGAQS
ncbi:type I restriction enzyme endonuclease domain-containing protein [Solidesulfovibrio alcoholivorans]|uniref:type I restriction enzyme endonuclease domain-containing protein n=1 Tax=Solidesulfovibrio alcoholivorans TaxID=81406 RepID=UPI000496CCF4|nr:type I restriction enzyme endonuclease domain-containing protein [Solidesulfovibrio alcoholivorans]